MGARKPGLQQKWWDYCVYCITCSASGKSYIGAAVHVFNRFGTHRHRLRRGKHENREMQADFSVHSEDSFSFTILSVHGRDRESAFTEERKVIRLFKDAGTAYNILSGSTSRRRAA